MIPFLIKDELKTSGKKHVINHKGILQKTLLL